MTITAKLVEDGKFLGVVPLSEDPGENELILALSGIPDKDMVAHTYGTVGEWEVLYVASQPKKRLVIGKMPKLLDSPKKRIDCTLTNEESERLVTSLEFIWKEFGCRM